MKSTFNASTSQSFGRQSSPSAIAAAVCAFLFLVITSCNSSGCYDNRSSIPLAGFYSSSSGTRISLDSIDIMGVGAPGDSLLLDSGTSASQVYLPLRSDSESVTFNIAYDYEQLFGLEDRLTFVYESYPYFTSAECGAMYRYRITDVRHTSVLLDSVAITAPDSIITNVEIETVQLYFRTAD